MFDVFVALGVGGFLCGVQRCKLMLAAQLAYMRLRVAELRGALSTHDLSQAPTDSLGRAGDRVTWLGALVNIVLAVTKFVAGTLGASPVMIADAVHSLSDLLSDGDVCCFDMPSAQWVMSC